MSRKEAGWPSWADTPEKRARNVEYWVPRNVPERQQLIIRFGWGRYAVVIPTPVYRTRKQPQAAVSAFAKAGGAPASGPGRIVA